MRSRTAVKFFAAILASTALGCAHDTTGAPRALATGTVAATMAIDTLSELGANGRFDKVYRYGDDSLTEQVGLRWKSPEAIELMMRAVNRRTGSSFSYAGTGLPDRSVQGKAFLSEEGAVVGSVRILLEGEEYARLMVIPAENGPVPAIAVPSVRLAAQR